MLLIDRLKEWITSVLGLVLLAGAGYLLYLGKITSGEFQAFLPVCIGLFWAKNTFITDMFKGGGGGTIAPVLILLLLSGCCTQQRCDRKFPTVQAVNDSTSSSTNETVQDKDSVSWLPADSSWLKALLECNKQGQVVMKELTEYKSGKYAQVPQVTIKDNMITAKCRVDSLAVFNHYSNRIKTEVQYRDRKVTDTKYINQLTPFQIWQIRCFWIESVIILLSIVFLILKFVSPWLKIL
ncbi:MAG: hypothetical protein WCR72_15235 [Bacteroidota bacterium]